jgi:hypothetical protein
MPMTVCGMTCVSEPVFELQFIGSKLFCFCSKVLSTDPACQVKSLWSPGGSASVQRRCQGGGAVWNWGIQAPIMTSSLDLKNLCVSQTEDMWADLGINF